MKKCIAVLCAVLLLLSLMTLSAGAADGSFGAGWEYVIAFGTCGNNIDWWIRQDGTMELSGTGSIPDYTAGNVPWAGSEGSITSVVIGGGISGIGANAFNGCSSLTNVTIPTAVLLIGENAFNGCDNLTDVLYCGTKTQKSAISLGSGNADLTDAAWTYRIYTLPLVIPHGAAAYAAAYGENGAMLFLKDLSEEAWVDLTEETYAAAKQLKWFVLGGTTCAPAGATGSVLLSES